MEHRHLVTGAALECLGQGVLPARAVAGVCPGTWAAEQGRLPETQARTHLPGSCSGRPHQALAFESNQSHFGLSLSDSLADSGLLERSLREGRLEWPSRCLVCISLN